MNKLNLSGNDLENNPTDITISYYREISLLIHKMHIKKEERKKLSNRIINSLFVILYRFIRRFNLKEKVKKSRFFNFFKDKGIIDKYTN